MGAYLSKPVTVKHSSDERSANLRYGATSMQGWRVSQEDAHNAILNFDLNTHLFAVYDGHGGHEVSSYTAMELPQVIKVTEAYKAGQVEEALTEAFLKFDETLTKPDVVNVLTQIAGSKEKDDSDESEEDVDDLYREATMPLAEVIAKYAENPQINRCKDKKAASPYLKAKLGGGGGSSSSSKDKESETKIEPGSSLNGSDEDATKVETEDQGKTIEPETSLNGSEDDKEDGEEKVVVNGEKVEDVDEVKDHVNGEVKSDLKTDLGDLTGTGKGQGKGTGKGRKGKALLKPSEIQAERNETLKKTRRSAAIKAAEIYRKIQDGKEEEDLDEEEDEEDDDETFEDEGEDGLDADGESDDDDDEEEEEDDDDDDDDDDEEEEEDDDEDDPYRQFALNMKEEPGFDSGCTACVAILKGNELYVANVGDSRCVVCQDGVAVDMSLDHKPEDEPEAERIRNAGGRVTADGRVNGGLNLSRAIGDHGYKQNKALPPKDQMISPLPDIKSMVLTAKDRFIIVACDGIWNSLTSQEACDFVTERLDKFEGDKDSDSNDKKLSSICEELFDHCLAPDTHGDGTGCDNMTCIIITLHDLAVGSNKRPLDSEETEAKEESVEEKVDPEERGKKQRMCCD